MSDDFDKTVQHLHTIWTSVLIDLLKIETEKRNNLLDQWISKLSLNDHAKEWQFFTLMVIDRSLTISVIYIYSYCALLSLLEKKKLKNMLQTSQPSNFLFPIKKCICEHGHSKDAVNQLKSLYETLPFSSSPQANTTTQEALQSDNSNEDDLDMEGFDEN